MADLSVNTSDSEHVWEDMGSNMVPNSGFESSPTFTAATNVTQRWIDGTAAGSTTNSTWSWSLASLSGTGSARFDNSTSNSGSNSMKLSITVANSTANVSEARRLANVADVVAFGVPIQASTAYKVTYWMTTALTSGSSRGAYLRVVDCTSSGTALTSHDGTFVVSSTGWAQYSISFTSGATAALLDFQLTVNGTTAPATLVMDAWFDDITLNTNPVHNDVSLTVGPIVTPGVQNISGPKIWS